MLFSYAISLSCCLCAAGCMTQLSLPSVCTRCTLISPRWKFEVARAMWWPRDAEPMLQCCPLLARTGKGQIRITAWWTTTVSALKRPRWLCSLTGGVGLITALIVITSLTETGPKDNPVSWTGVQKQSDLMSNGELIWVSSSQSGDAL